jgi:hypothetical protein
MYCIMQHRIERRTASRIACGWSPDDADTTTEKLPASTVSLNRTRIVGYPPDPMRRQKGLLRGGESLGTDAFATSQEL